MFGELFDKPIEAVRLDGASDATRSAALEARRILGLLFGADGNAQGGQLHLRCSKDSVQQGMPLSETYIIVHGLLASQRTVYTHLCAGSRAAGSSVPANALLRLKIMQMCVTTLHSLKSSCLTAKVMGRESSHLPCAPRQRVCAVRQAASCLCPRTCYFDGRRASGCPGD